MLTHELQGKEGILVLTPDGPLEALDFTTLARHVDAYLEQNGTLHGVMVRAKAFPGWKDFGAFVAHLKFVKRHHHKIEKVAVVADGAVAAVMPQIASHFVHADVKHFDYGQEAIARSWLLENSSTQTRTAA